MAAAVASLTDALRDVLLPIVYLSRVESRIINSYIKITHTGIHLIGVSTAAHAARQHSIHLVCRYSFISYTVCPTHSTCAHQHIRRQHTPREGTHKPTDRAQYRGKRQEGP